uniref:Uncharacterized protein n=1 Tax=Romanomermis culicivorax TaxID=13658 RepID=A0A915JYR6_ROMCU
MVRLARAQMKSAHMTTNPLYMYKDRPKNLSGEGFFAQKKQGAQAPKMTRKPAYTADFFQWDWTNCD